MHLDIEINDLCRFVFTLIPTEWDLLSIVRIVFLSFFLNWIKWLERNESIFYVTLVAHYNDNLCMLGL